MMVSALAVASTSNTIKHPVGALAVARREGQSKGCRGEEEANCGDIQEVGPLTPKAAAGGVTRGLATTPRSKGKGKAKARDEEDKDIEEQIEETFTDKHLVTLLHWQKAFTVVDTGLGAGMKLEKVKVASKEGEGDVEMREMTPLAMVAEVEPEASNMEVKGEEEFEAAPATIEEDEEEEWAEEGTWSDTPLCQVGNNELEWLGEDLGWPTSLTSAASLADFDERAAGVERQFQRELEAAKEELLVAQACYAVTK
ncbi:hypothetical protein E4T56_gene8236 [Termitomyces sp. T112]|nr:hypothetical protein E4T56_gene8236 [Termitomyces sp. T112]